MARPGQERPGPRGASPPQLHGAIAGGAAGIHHSAVSKSRLHQRTIAVTGAGTGIGRAIALRLAAEGASVALHGRRLEPLQETARACREAGVPTHVGCFDVQDRGAVDRAVAEATAALGPLHGFVANAGVGGPNEPGEADRFDELVATNLLGTYSCFRAAQRHLAPGPGPRHLLATSSILGRIGVAGYTGYCASKAGILGLVRALATELAPENVQVNALCPGWVDTAMAWQGLQGMADALQVPLEQAHALAMGDVPMGRMSQPEHIAGFVAFLLSDDATGITGQALDMNNGAFMS
jgi:NAD(P)-dependent dehydrogenase (short-subunit alcohol dehydrogenase family)